MKRENLTEKILDIKREKWLDLEAYLRTRSAASRRCSIVGALLGQMKLVKPLARKAAELFGLAVPEEAMLNEIPYCGMPMPPTDPLIYRFYELVMVNGPAWKALIEEEFGDGIMSAIDFNFEFVREPNPKGDRCVSRCPANSCLIKYYGAEQGFPEYGYKEERLSAPTDRELRKRNCVGSIVAAICARESLGAESK